MILDLVLNINLDGWEWFFSAFVIGSIFFYCVLRSKKK